MVVHREPEQDHEQEQRHPRGDRAGRAGSPRNDSRWPVLEDPDEHPVGGADRQQVEHDRLDRDHDRAERDQQQQERRRQHEREDERRVRLHRVVEVLRAGGAARHVGRRARDPLRSSRDRIESRSCGQRAFGGLSRCRLPTIGMSTCATVRRAVDFDVTRLLEQRVRRGPRAQRGDRRRDFRARSRRRR